MTMPRLLFPIPCSIQPLNRGETHYDEDLREPIQGETYDTTIVVPGQVMWLTQSNLDATASGVTEQSNGYAVFRYIDLKYFNIELKREDRIIKLGTQLVDVYIYNLQPIAHRTELGGPALVKAFFRDKQKSRNNPGI